MAHIIGIAGSLRQQSFNLGLLNAASKLMPGGSMLSVHTINAIPLYNADEEQANGLPDAVAALKEAIAAADGVLLATP